MGVLGLFILGSCNSKSAHDHEGHDHGTETHEHEGHDHEGHDHGSECNGHDGENKEKQGGTEGHRDEIILPKAKAEAAGVKVSVIEPGTFEQVWP